MTDSQTAQGLERMPAAHFDVVAIASSAGGLRALTVLLRGLPRDLPATLLISQHLDPRRPSRFAELLGRSNGVQVREARQGDALRPGLALIAPPNFHLLLQPDYTLSLSSSEPVAFSRPSADVMLRSVAAVCGPRAIAVVLTGMGSDGAAGVSAIHRAGGMVLAEDPRSARYASMPSSAEQSGMVHYVLPLEAIAPQILHLLYQGRPA